MKQIFVVESSALLSVCPQWNDSTIKIKFVKVVPIEIVTFHMTNSSSSPFLALIQDGKIGRFGMSSLEVSNNNRGFVCSTSLSYLNTIFRWSFPFPYQFRLWNTCVSQCFHQNSRSLNFCRNPRFHYQVLSEREVSCSVAVIRSPPTVIQ